jgi:hypothetical protein
MLSMWGIIRKKMLSMWGIIRKQNKENVMKLMKGVRG